MARQAWKYSGNLDERDLAFLQHEFITIPMGIDYFIVCEAADKSRNPYWRNLYINLGNLCCISITE